LVADRAYRDPKSLTLPAGTRNVHVDFSVLSFSNSRAARVRYRVDGQDSDWIDAGNRRQAFYTNLTPGRYRFRLMAANDGGVWNRHEATVDFVIPPTFVQSNWFIAVCVLLVALCLWLAYRVRLGHIARSIRSRLEERLGERERIARELHDTLLQGVQGLVLRFQSVANKMSAEEASRVKLEVALRRADEVIADARNRVQNLRSSDAPSGLPELLRSRASEAPFDPPIPIRIVVEGRAREVDPLVAVEVSRIVDEALLNAARHSKASLIEIMLRFGPRHLGLEVHDDGVGFPPSILEKGHKSGHFGLVGMRERAERIGGDFTIECDPALGATVAVTFPARVAYAGAVSKGRWPRSPFRRRRDAEHV
jgi:signal transduction histidine kinase